MNDIELIYEALKDRYELILTNSFALDDGFTWDVPIICGESELGRFQLYADANTPEPHGVQFVFTLPDRPTHGHPQTIEDAIDEIERFMAGEDNNGF